MLNIRVPILQFNVEDRLRGCRIDVSFEISGSGTTAPDSDSLRKFEPALRVPITFSLLICIGSRSLLTKSDTRTENAEHLETASD
jgi:hypothetical protein